MGLLQEEHKLGDHAQAETVPSAAGHGPTALEWGWASDNVQLYRQPQTRRGDDSGPGSIGTPSGIAGDGAGDKLLCPLLPSAPQMPPVSPSNQLTHNSIAKDLLLLSLLSQVTCSALLLVTHSKASVCTYMLRAR